MGVFSQLSFSREVQRDETKRAISRIFRIKAKKKFRAVNSARILGEIVVGDERVTAAAA